jgi:hypothetical protein
MLTVTYAVLALPSPKVDFHVSEPLEYLAKTHNQFESICDGVSPTARTTVCSNEKGFT